MQLIRIRRKFTRLFNADDTELAPAPGGEGVKEKTETVQALERELTRHGLDLADVVDLFSHDVASEDEDEPTEASEERLPTPVLQAAQGFVNCAHGHPLGYVCHALVVIHRYHYMIYSKVQRHPVMDNVIGR